MKKSHYQGIADSFRHRAGFEKSLHVALVFHGAELLGAFTNRYGSRSSGVGYSARSIHAEREALRQLGHSKKLYGARMVVLRINKQGELLYSRPCDECMPALQKAIQKYKIQVYYS